MYQPQDPLLQAGLEHQRRQDWPAAAACYQQALPQAPLESRFLLGWLAFEQAQWPEATRAFEDVLRDQPDFWPAWVLQGNLALMEENPVQALRCFTTAQSLAPNETGIQLSLGQAHLKLQAFPEAIAALSTFLQDQPRHLPGWQLLAQAYQHIFWTFHQAQCLERAQALDPTDPELLENLGSVWLHLGQPQALQHCLNQLLALGPAGEAWFASLPPSARNWAIARRDAYLAQYLLLLYADPAVPDPLLFDQIDRIPRSEAVAARPVRSGAAEPWPDRPLRVGYFSREFGRHSSMQLILPLLQHHSTAVELFAYDDAPDKPDKAVFEPLFAHWCNLSEFDHAAAAERIRADQLDILIDLAGLTHAHRWPLFARHPAPVQVSGLGFVFSSACREIDYCFSDQVLCPPEVAARYPETVVHLTSAFHWQPPPPIPLTEPPCLQQGYLTLGSANTLNKLNETVIRLWARLLQQLPTARLFLKTPMLNDPLTCRFYRELFGHFGIASERLRLEGLTSEVHIDYFYSQIDIALDPFPYQGGVSTCEALWMGVPVVSLFQPQWRSRALTASILTAIGLASWLTSSEADYLQRVQEWADPAFLQFQRQSLRGQLLASPICDGAAAAREIESALFRLYALTQTQAEPGIV